MEKQDTYLDVPQNDTIEEVYELQPPQEYEPQQDGGDSYENDTDPVYDADHPYADHTYIVESQDQEPTNPAYITLDSIVQNTQDNPLTATLQAKPIMAIYCELTGQSLRSIIDNNNERLNALACRVGMLENRLFDDIPTNLFDVSFANLDGLLVLRGVWNATLQRVEC